MAEQPTDLESSVWNYARSEARPASRVGDARGRFKPLVIMNMMGKFRGGPGAVARHDDF
jgi:hypothetical protein